MNFLKYYTEAVDQYYYHGSLQSFDSFDISKIKSGDGLNKYGTGIYFTDSEDLANYYANNRGYIYQVRLRNINDYYDWESDIGNIYDSVIRELRNIDKDDSAEEIVSDYESYGDYWTMNQLYDWLTAVIGSEVESSKFLYDIGVSGIKAKDLHDRGNIFVTFNTDDIKIIDKWKVGERE